ncbi:hypothetical protein Oscil6304_5922 [Oscillatoria acuminata PCC 6304]|uniref:Uncharacterized protein n=1 Tax=Oscillatoria acuminata PCC 6304 TaxID=56110 RepID=K9TS62_9CYAN|nr:hypothetical protein Oscil6304_5922 [Oscillatoria acuminata PCC 6304]
MFLKWALTLLKTDSCFVSPLDYNILQDDNLESFSEKIFPVNFKAIFWWLMGWEGWGIV